MTKPGPTTDAATPLVQRLLPNLLAIAIGLGTAYALQWETRDLVWGLWLSSLVTGYATILAALGGGAIIGVRVLRHEEFPTRYRLPGILTGVGMGLFLLGFFSLHFCGFHAGHSVFLQQFFPLEGVPNDGFGRAFMNPPLLWAFTYRHLLKPYGIFLVAALLVERKHVFGPLRRAVHAVRESGDLKRLGKKALPDGKSGSQSLLGDAMARPYVNVVRMHLLIFFFAACHFMKVESFVVYATVYAVYFFPWGELKRRRHAHG